MKYKCWYDTKIDVTNVFHANWKIPDHTKQHVWYFRNEEIFSQEWMEYMHHELHMPLGGAMVFYKEPGVKTDSAHVDIVQRKRIQRDNLGLNWVLSGEDSDMVWYDEGKLHSRLMITAAGTPYYTWTVDDSKEIDRCRIGKNTATIVNPGIPHNIHVYSEPRWGISARLILPRYIPFGVFVDHLKDLRLIT
jgi:hypothetical protein